MRTLIVPILMLAGLAAPLPAQQVAPLKLERLHPRAFGLADVRGPRLGVSIKETSDGLSVQEVNEDSLAMAAGVQVGDILVRIGDERLIDTPDVRRALSSYSTGDEVSITVVRSGQGLVTLQAPLPEEAKSEEESSTDGALGGFLGVDLGEESDQGVAIDKVEEGTAAWHAGLQHGDVLTRIGEQEVRTAADVVGAVSSRSPGTMVELAYLRDGEAQTARARLSARRPPGLFGLGTPGAFRLSDDDAMPFVHRFMPGMHDMDQMFELGEGAHQVRIEIQDGVMTVTRDGETKTYELDDDNGATIDLEGGFESLDLQDS